MYLRIRDLRNDSDMTQILIKLARFYNTSIDYLLGETDRRERYK